METRRGFDAAFISEKNNIGMRSGFGLRANSNKKRKK